MTRARSRARVTGPEVDAVLTACRCLVALSVRSMATVGTDLEPTQFRALIVVASRGSVSLGELADNAGISLSTASRLCDRLVGLGLLDRTDDPADRRQLLLTLTAAGRRVVDEVTDARRADLVPVLQRMTRTQRDQLINALQVFSDGCRDEDDERHLWGVGWVTTPA